MMRRFCCGVSLALLLLAPVAVAAAQEKSTDLRRAVPADAYLATYGRHNPERDFQRKYYEDVWKTVEETQIFEKAIKIVTDRLPEQDVKKAEALVEEVRQAIKPIDVKAIADVKEVVYAAVMPSPRPMMPTTPQHLLLMRLAPGAAASTLDGIENLFKLIEKYSGGKVPVETAKVGHAKLVTLSLPPQVPYRPTVAQIGDVFVFSTMEELAHRSLGMLVSGEGKSKFDDPRLQEALKRLPEPEDGLVFFDISALFSKLGQIPDFIRQESKGDPKAARVAEMVGQLVDETNIFDYEVTVQYTEGNLNRTAHFGRFLPGSEDKMLSKMLRSGQPFDEWQSWVPAGALSYSLSSGVNLHPLYEGIVGALKEKVPESAPALEKFEALQDQIGVHVDKDILQAFSGECVSVSLPAAVPSPFGGQDSVTALRCENPERIRELLHRLVEKLNEIPMVNAQQLMLAQSEKLDGFDELSALMLSNFGVKPVVGFRDGWMYIGSNTLAVQKVLDTRGGQGETVVDSDAFKQFKLDIEGPVRSVRYANLASNNRQMTQFLNQAGILAPMIMGMAGAQAGSEELKPVQEVLALLPDLAKIVAKFDFLEAKVSATQEGDEPGTYRRYSVVVVRPES